MSDSANSNTPAQAFDMRSDDEGWRVRGIATSDQARVNDVPQTGSDMGVSDDIVDLLTLSPGRRTKALASQQHPRAPSQPGLRYDADGIEQPPATIAYSKANSARGLMVY